MDQDERFSVSEERLCCKELVATKFN